MPQITINSSTINSFGWSATLDIANRSILFNLLPFTSGANLNNIPVSFFVQDQDGVVLSEINWSSPQIANAATTTSWTLDLSAVNYAFLFQTYQIYGAIQDTNGNVYPTNPIYPEICQPNDFTDAGNVPGLFQIIPDCINSVLTIKEITPMVYNKLTPQSVSKTGTLYYPTGTLASVPFTKTSFSNNVIYTGQYRVQCDSVATYAIGNDVYVLVSYYTNNEFPVTCNNRMSDIVCCITKLQQTAIRNCNNTIGENAKQQLSDISLYVMNGLLKEISGQDAQFEVDYIKKYLSCSCGSASLSQSEFTPINPAVTSIVLNGGGGTSVPSPTTTGNTKTYTISSNIYQVTKGDAGDLAFKITIDTTVNNTVKYVITFNYDTMAGYILTAIQNDPSLLSQLNSLVQETGVNLQGLDGKCVIDLTQVTYSLSQSFTGSTLVTNIVINGINYAAPSNLFANNPTAVANWLNSLSLGSFSANVSSGIITILSSNNTNVVSTLTFTNPNVVKPFQATNITLVQVLQAIINYLCQLTSLQIALGNNLTLCQFDYNGSVIQTNYTGTGNNPASQGVFNSGVAAAICNIVSRISTLSGITCANIQAIFSDNPSAVFNNGTDWYMAVVGGSCTKLSGKQQAIGLISAINSYSDVKTAFCNINCTTPATCPDISNINFSSINQTTIGFYGVTWNTTPLANQIVTVRYRVSGTTTWTVASNAINLFPNGNINGTTPYQIPGLTAGTTYDVWVQNNCGGNGFVSQVTTPSNTVYSGSYLLNNSIYSICGGSPSTLYSNLPFASGITMYSDVGLTTPVTGFLFIVSTTSNQIYQLNSSTGVVGANTGNNCVTGTAGSYILGNDTSTICSGSVVTLYTNGAFSIGGVLYSDSALTTPVTGYAYVVRNSISTIYNLNSSTGAIGSNTHLSCSSAIANTFRYGTSMTICSVTPITLYSASAPTTGVTLYNDIGLTSPFTGYNYIAPASVGDIYTINSTNGVIGSFTGVFC
jgi:hypothetical protein